MKTKNEYREYLADTFIKSIEEEGLNWKKGWVGLESPRNPVTGVTYRGVNRFVLSMVAQERGYTDPRWCTYNQIQESKWWLKGDAKGQGVQIEYWVPLHPETNKPTTWDKANEYRKENPGTTIKSVPTFFYVFNAEHIKGIPERELRRNVEIKIEDIVPKISQNMGVEIVNDTSNRAYYSPREDKVHLPKPEQFLSSYDYHATAMHELAHASGAESRLHRDLSGRFGTPSYAFEELVAEMSATFMSEHLPYELPEEHLESHKAYIQSWTQAIKNNPEYLIQAIKKADECANYLEEKGEISRELEMEKTITQELTVEEKLQAQIKGHEEAYRDFKSLGFEIGYTEGFTEDGFVHFTAKDVNIGFPSWEEANSFVDDVYNAVINFSKEDLQDFLLGYYEVIEYATMLDNTAIIAFQNYDNLHTAMLLDLMTEKDSPGMQGIYTQLYENNLLKDIEVIYDMKTLGFEVDFTELEKSNLVFHDKAGQLYIPKDIDSVYEVVMDVYNAAENYSPEQLNNFISGSEPVPENHQSSMDKKMFFSAVLENKENLLFAKEISRTSDTLGWQEVYKGQFFQREIDNRNQRELQRENAQSLTEQTQQPKSLDVRTVVPENEFKQIDRAKGDVHIFQDKKDAGNNFLGKRQEVNGVKSIKKLSPVMDLKTANEKLKEIRLQAKLEKPEQTLQKAISKSQALSIGRGR